MVWAGQHWHGGPRSAKWASTSRANAAIPSRACRATPKLLEARSAADFRVENGLHWVLDLAFQEDASRMHKDHSQQNFVVFRHMALNLLKQEEYFRFIRRDAAKAPSLSDRATLTPEEAAWASRYGETTDRLMLIAGEYRDLLEKKPRTSFSMSNPMAKQARAVPSK